MEQETSLFKAPGFTALWSTQLVSSFGDWLGFLAVIDVANRIGGDNAGSAIALVVIVRVLPGFFLASAGGVIVDRFNRKKLLVWCDIVRALVLLTIPFINAVWSLVLASLALELATSLWSPAKEAIVPNIVPAKHLSTANSLGLVAAYGTFPLGAGAFALLATLGRAFGWGPAGQVNMALVIDAGTFLVAAALIGLLPLEHHRPKNLNGAKPGQSGQSSQPVKAGKASRMKDKINFAQGIHELREGWNFIFLSPQVRAVLVGLGTGMIGGGMVVPLGVVFSDEVLNAGASGFSSLLVAMGLGAGAGVGLVTATQNRVSITHVFVFSVFVAGGSLVVAATLSNTILVLASVLMLGIAAGAVYVAGFTLLHKHVDEQLRGRVFSALYTLVRFCLLLAIALGGLLADGFDWLFEIIFADESGADPSVSIAGYTLTLPGVRGALWFGGFLVLFAGVLAAFSFRAGETDRAGDDDHADGTASPTATSPTAESPTATSPTAESPAATSPTAESPAATSPTADRSTAEETGKKSTEATDAPTDEAPMLGGDKT